MALIYKPIGIVLGILAGLLGKRVFDFVWTKIDDEDPPKATTEETSWAKLLTAAAVQGVIFKTTRVVVDRYGARGWSLLTGTWPGEKRPDRADPAAQDRAARALLRLLGQCAEDRHLGQQIGVPGQQRERIGPEHLQQLVVGQAEQL